MPEKTLIIDDSSPQIAYSGQWDLGGVEQEYNHTTHGSWTKGSQATISFTGAGISIEVYGTIGREQNNGDPAYSPITTYVIDGNNDSASTFTGTPETAIMYNQLLYQSPKLDRGEHQLVVTLTNSNMNPAWIDYFQVEQPTHVASTLIAGVVIGGVLGISLLLIIWFLLRRISRLSQRKVQYEKVPRKATHTYWPWMTRPPADVTPFGSDPFSESHPLSLNSIHDAPPESEETSLSGYTTRGSTVADKASNRDSNTSGHAGLSGYTTRGGTSADKTPSPTSASTSRNLNDPGHTSLSGYTTQGGTFADKTVTLSPTSPRTNRASNTSYSGNTVADQINRRSRPTSDAARTIDNPPTNGALDLVPRPFLAATTTNRLVVEGEEAPPAYGRSVFE
ncbi:hypothetical protein C0991_004179 [Blastosporella zonata]|nr:hypothetical protein C0991_004179 [Blastosporella zonata]